MIKSVAVYGDSISCGKYTGPDDSSPDSVVARPWHRTVGRHLGAEVTDYSVSGISASRTSEVMSSEALSLRYDRIEGDPDVIFIAVGTNDFGTNVPLGSPSDRQDVSFRGALHTICSGLREKYRLSRVFWLLPLGRRGMDKNDAGHSLAEYRRTISDVCAGYGIPVIDANRYGLDSDSPVLIKMIMKDGVHPDQSGHDLLAGAIIRYLKQNSE